MPESPTSANGQSHKSFKDSERPVKVFQDLESEPTPENALTRVSGPVLKNAGACRLCGPEGWFLDPDGYPVTLIEDIDADDWIEHPVVCQHSMDGNLAEIRRWEKATGFELGKTRWRAIDSHYPGRSEIDDVDYNP
jgi:hypothetical protein